MFRPCMIDEEFFKGTIHGVLGTLLAIGAAYNAMRWCGTRQRRNAVNVLLYVPGAWHEWRQVKYHFSQPRAVPLIDVNARRA